MSAGHERPDVRALPNAQREPRRLLGVGSTLLFGHITGGSALMLLGVAYDDQESSGKDDEGSNHNPDHYASSNSSIRR